MKRYKKPICVSHEMIKGIAPLAGIVAAAAATELAPTAALLGGYAAGKSVSRAFGYYIENYGNIGLTAVIE